MPDPITFNRRLYNPPTSSPRSATLSRPARPAVFCPLYPMDYHLPADRLLGTCEGSCAPRFAPTRPGRALFRPSGSCI